MVDHVEPIVDRVVPVPAALGRARNRLLVGRFAWVLDEALLFPVVALYLMSLAGNLPGELLSDSWLVILGGREVAHHGLPIHDVLTIWAHGRHWVDQQWLGQLIFYGLYAAGGIKLALLGHVAAAGSAFVLAVILARKSGGSVRSIGWISIPVIFLIMWGSWNARAQSLAILFYVLLVWLLVRESRRPSRKVFLALPLLVLWANVHGTVITGALLVVVYAFTFAFEQRRRPLGGWAPRASLLCAGAIAAVFASPYATSLPAYYDRMLFNSGFRDYVVEWRPTTPSFQTAPFFLLAFMAVWLVGRAHKRLTRFEQVLLAVTILMGLESMRGVIWFTFPALLLIPPMLDGVLKPNTSAMRFRVLNRALVATSLAGVLVSLSIVAAKPTSWSERNYPQGVLAAVRHVEATNPRVRVFAHEQYADWLLLRRPELSGRIAYDARFELISGAQLKRLVDARRRVEGWQKVIAPYGLFVLKKGVESYLAAGLLRQPGARLQYRGHGVIVISRPVELVAR